MKLLLLLLALLVLFNYRCKAQDKKIERSCPLVFDIHKNGGTQSIRYAANHPLNILDTNINTVLVYIHGINRNGLDYFEYGEDAVKLAKQKKKTLLVAPQYADESDLDYYHLNNTFLYWKKTEWKDGYTSISDNNRPQEVKISSYEIMDSLLNNILTSNKFPNIKMVVVAGHSAGGQFVQRYSATTPMPDLFTAAKFRFIVMDPSSYMYPDGKRPAGNNNFSIPDTTGCPTYNYYPKGLEKLNTYAKAMGTNNIFHNIMRRDIIILLGEKDVKTDDPNLDVTCAATLQGPFRLQRGLNYMAYLATFPEYGNKKSFNVVPDSGHNGDKMINSDAAVSWIFGK